MLNQRNTDTKKPAYSFLLYAGFFTTKCGRSSKIRTCDLTSPRRTRYQAALYPETVNFKRDYIVYWLYNNGLITDCNIKYKKLIR